MVLSIADEPRKVFYRCNKNGAAFMQPPFKTIKRLNRYFFFFFFNHNRRDVIIASSASALA